MSATLRIAREADLPAIVEIYNATIAHRTATADLEPVSVQSRRAWFHEHTPEHHPLWVAERSGRVLGWVSLQPFHARCAYRTTAEVSVYVQASEQRTGVGRALVRHAIEAAPGLGLRTLVALVFGHNAPSLTLFAKLGFAPWGELPAVAELDGVERDLVLLGLRVA